MSIRVRTNLPVHKSRYFVAIVPPNPVFDEVLQLKNYFKDKYQSKAALNSPPHITLQIPFFWKDDEESFLIASLKVFALKQRSQTIELSDFSAFEPKVIFIGVSESEMLYQLQSELSQFFKSELNLFKGETHERAFHPHLTLAFRDLKKVMFLQAWEEFCKRRYSASFCSDKITLLKHNGKVWESYKDFHFQSDFSTLY